MDKEKFEKIIAVLVEKIERLETDIFVKDIEIERLKKDNAQLNEFLNPTKKDGKENED